MRAADELGFAGAAVVLPLDPGSALLCVAFRSNADGVAFTVLEEVGGLQLILDLAVTGLLAASLSLVAAIVAADCFGVGASF